jgi:Signal transduction histidine kinase
MKRGGLSFAARLNAWFAIVVILLSIALFLIAYLLLYRAVQEREREIVRSQLDVYRAWYAEGGLQSLTSRFLEREDKESFFVRVIGPEGVAVFASVPKQAGGLDLDKLRGLTPTEAIELDWLTVPTRNRRGNWLVATARLPDGSWLQVGKTTEALAELLAQFRTVFGWVALAALVLGVAGGAWLARRALAPVRQLIGTVENVIATGQMDRRMPVPQTNDEISNLARLFNDMLEKNEMLIRRMREALDNVAHDLRTPLTRLRGVAELALQGEPNAETCRDALLDAMEESDRVLTMLNTLMDISEAETGLMKLDLQPVPLDQVVREVTELFEFVAQEKSITITTTISANLVVRADRNRLRQVLVNLLDNAIKYSAPGAHVEISAEPSPDEVVITVRDTGTGIPAGEIPRIWERLYRGDKSRSQRGLGLGLSLVRAIIRAHGGRIEVQSTVGKGSSFAIHLPKL